MFPFGEILTMYSRAHDVPQLIEILAASARKVPVISVTSLDVFVYPMNV